MAKRPRVGQSLSLKGRLDQFAKEVREQAPADRKGKPF
jgi:hypothetical protein